MLRRIWKAIAHACTRGTCKSHGCGYQQVGNDDRCAICRRPLD